MFIQSLLRIHHIVNFSAQKIPRICLYWKNGDIVEDSDDDVVDDIDVNDVDDVDVDICRFRLRKTFSN